MPERFRSLSRPDDELTLLDLADRLLNRGVMITGEATISVAGIDLIYLGLSVVLTAAENLTRGGQRSAVRGQGRAPTAGDRRGDG